MLPSDSSHENLPESTVSVIMELIAALFAAPPGTVDKVKHFRGG
jgi:hypothetical protein